MVIFGLYAQNVFGHLCSISLTTISSKLLLKACFCFCPNMDVHCTGMHRSRVSRLGQKIAELNNPSNVATN